MKNLNKTKIYLIILILFLGNNVGYAIDFQHYPELTQVVEVMIKEDGYTRAELENILQMATIDPTIIALIKHPHEALPWHKYRQLFINRERVRKGVAYWDKHEATLERAAQTYGVPPAVIVALLGVETHFGTRLGTRRVLDALVTLTVDYPRRSQYFAKELRVFLNTVRKEKIAPQSVIGSYAGAVGIPQFMPSSYQTYAVDFNNNSQRDLVNENADAIGSVANYLKRHGWKNGQTIFQPLNGQLPPGAQKLVSENAKPSVTAAQLKAVDVAVIANHSKKMALLQLQEAESERYIIAFRNFYAITRYNSSVNYAMAVVELAQKISHQRTK